MDELANALTPLPYFYDTHKAVSVKSPSQCKSTSGLILTEGQGDANTLLLRYQGKLGSKQENLQSFQIFMRHPPKNLVFSLMPLKLLAAAQM